MSAAAGQRTRRLPPEEQPVRRPPRNKGREIVLALMIGAAWFGAAYLATGGDPRHTLDTGEGVAGLVALGIACWLAAELVSRRLLLLWPGSALGIFGPVAFGLAAAGGFPETRAMAPLEQLPVIYGVCSGGMLLFLLRFRLPGLVSPIALSATLALFLWMTHGSPEALARVEGLTPRGILAALLDRPVVVAVFGTLSLGACWLGWRLDRKADYFGVEAARPLHIVGGGILALIAGKHAGMLPSGLDVAAILALFAGLLVWSLRIDRMAVFSTGTVAMTRPLFLALLEPFGTRLDFAQWGGVYTAMVGLAMIVWLLARRRAVALGWTRKVRNIRWDWSDPTRWSRRSRQNP